VQKSLSISGTVVTGENIRQSRLIAIHPTVGPEQHVGGSTPDREEHQAPS